MAGKPSSIPLVERFWAKVEKSAECWLWTGATCRGYGIFAVDGRPRRTARLSVEWDGRVIPNGMHVDHLCRTPLCVRPDHLEIVTPQENTRRKMQAFYASHPNCPSGHPLVGDNLFFESNGNRRCRTCSRQRSRVRNARRIPSDPACRGLRRK